MCETRHESASWKKHAMSDVCRGQYELGMWSKIQYCTTSRLLTGAKLWLHLEG